MLILPPMDSSQTNTTLDSDFSVVRLDEDLSWCKSISVGYMADEKNLKNEVGARSCY